MTVLVYNKTENTFTEHTAVHIPVSDPEFLLGRAGHKPIIRPNFSKTA